MLNETTPERSHSFSKSIEAGLLVASSLGLSTSFTAFGDKLPMYRCDVTDAAGLKIQGKGKGLGDQSIASALFEAIEHYCYVSCKPENLLRLKLGEHPLDGEIVDGSPSFSLLSRRQAPPLTRIIFEKINALGIEIAAPAFLFNPEFKSTSARESEFLRISGLRRYATNSGTASGTTIEDAQLHAIME
ncbi:MAG: YcaO-like family protein, partial [Inquilinus limosus]|nr:YcaO-like family protein [Inquilinus limosus]